MTVSEYEEWLRISAPSLHETFVAMQGSGPRRRRRQRFWAAIALAGGIMAANEVARTIPLTYRPQDVGLSPRVQPRSTHCERALPRIKPTPPVAVFPSSPSPLRRTVRPLRPSAIQNIAYEAKMIPSERARERLEHHNEQRCWWTSSAAQQRQKGMAFSFLHRERTIAASGYNRWLILPAALCVHLCIGQLYAFSVFNLTLTKLIGITQSTSEDWKLTELGWIFSLAIVFLGASAAVLAGCGKRSRMWPRYCLQWPLRDDMLGDIGCAVEMRGQKRCSAM
jgi:hypothetical protein